MGALFLPIIYCGAVQNDCYSILVSTSIPHFIKNMLIKKGKQIGILSI